MEPTTRLLAHGLDMFSFWRKCKQSKDPVAVVEPHFKVFPEFRDASYAKRYELLCRKLVRKVFTAARHF